MVDRVTPTGSEHTAKTRGFQASAGDVPPLVPPSAAICAHHDDPEAEELLALWASLDDAERADLLAVARGLASGKAQGVKASG